MNILFLDFDGVVNSLIWGENDYRYGSPSDGKVNNYQACKWVSLFCKEYNFSVVISSAWRAMGLERCVEFLHSGGFDKEIPIIDVTPRLRDSQRGDEISSWLKKHDVEKYLIFDDDSDMTIHVDHLVKSDTYIGFTFRDYQKAKSILTSLYGVKTQFSLNLN